MWMILTAVFLGVTALFVGAAMIWSDRRAAQHIEQRLGAFSDAFGSARGPVGSAQPLTLLESARSHPRTRWSPVNRLHNLIDQADSAMTLRMLCGMSAGLAVLGVVAALMLGARPIGSLAGAGCGAIPTVFLLHRRRQRLKKFGEQLSDALELVARALRAGHSLASGLQLVSQEMPSPINVEFQRTYDEQNLGISLDVALDNLTDRVPNVDLRFFVTAVSIQRQVGGDLAEILDKLGYIIRERFKIYGQVRALTAEGRVSGWILNTLPVVVFLALLKLNPDYVSVLFDDPMGRNMLMGSIVLQFIGAMTIRRIVNIRI